MCACSAYLNVCVYVHVHSCVYEYTVYAHRCVHMCIHDNVRMRVCVYTCACMHVHMCVYVHMCTCVHYVCISVMCM